MKKILASLVLTLALGMSSITGVSAMNVETTEIAQGDVLDWNIFTKSNAILEANGKGKRLDCDAVNIQNYITRSATDLEGYESDIESLKTEDPGYVRDIKGCIMQEKVDSFLTWAIYLVVICLIIYVIFSIAMNYVGGGSSQGGGGNDMMDPGNSGGDDKVMDKVKGPLYAAGILFLIALGALNIFLELLAWIVDAVVG